MVKRKIAKAKVSKILKRDGSIVSFDESKIKNAISKALLATEEVENPKETAIELAQEVVKILQKKFHSRSIPAVEEVQDIVEETLILNRLTKTAKAYILYRDQRAKLRDIENLVDSGELMEGYLKQLDWRVKENSNMSFSLQGLNNHVASTVSSRYWLNKVYPRPIRDAHVEGDFHIHDLQLLAPYCAGWDLKDLLFRGFGGVSGKIESKPPKHFRTALGQMVNFFYTLQGEVAGAEAFSNFDTYLAPFVHYDKLGYSEVKQALQEFLFNVNVPTRVGFQCVSEDTEILAQDGWKTYKDIKEGDIIATFNVEKSFIEYLPVRHVFARKYKGKMYHLQNRITDQLISPEHRVVRKRFGAEGYVLEKIEKVLELKSPFIVPVGSNGHVNDDNLSDDVVKLIAWVVAEGSIDKSGRGSGRISIYQSKIKNPHDYEEIVSLCHNLNLHYTERTQQGLGEETQVLRFDAPSTRKILKYFNSNKEKGIKFIPDIILNSGAETAKLFLETYIKGDGYDQVKIVTTSPAIKDGLLQVIVNAGYGATVSVRQPDNGLSEKDRYIIRIIKHRDTYVNKVKEVNYDGVIWCPNTDNETIIARRNGKVFITGNTPFTNITMDLFVPEMLKDEAVIVGGRPQDKKYGDFQKEMDMINQAFAELMMEGDAKGRVFTFPIPTYNITKDFDWDNPVMGKVFEMTAKYGIPYFSNFINSDMKPEDARSMCPLASQEKVLIKSSRGRKVEYSSIGNIYNGNSSQEKYEIYSDGQFVSGRFNKFENQEMIKVILENNHEIKMSESHLNFVRRNENSPEEELIGKELEVGMYLPYSLNVYKGEGGNRDLGYFVGAFAGDGSFDGEGTVVFSLENQFKGEVITKLTKIAKNYFGAGIAVQEHNDSKLVTLKVHSKAAVGLCKDFVEGKEKTKHYKARLFTASLEFRKGVLAGHYAADGGNRNRIYTSSPKMVESLNMLAATLGTTTSIYKDDREGRLGKAPNYAVLFYKLNRERYGKVWFKKGGKLWMRIKKIKKIKNSIAYCFEVENGKPIFTVGTTGILTHNCRLRLDNRELRKRGGGLFGANPLTGSIGVVTINLPRIGYLAKKKYPHDKEEAKKYFYERLARLMDLARDSLEIKRKIVEDLTEKGLYPYARHYLNGIKAKFNHYWQNHFATIGINGMNEAIINLIGVNIAHAEGKSFGLKIMDYMRDRLGKYQNDTNNLYNLEATPAEGVTRRFANADKEKYPDIIVANEKEVREKGVAPYYTNSTHLPVDYSEDIFEVLDLQDELQTKYTGGTVIHGFVGERMPSAEATKNLVRKIAENYRLPYYTITPTFSVCPTHGYISGEEPRCPHCQAETEVYSRVVGYLRPVKQWNDAKQAEFEKRLEYVVEM